MSDQWDWLKHATRLWPPVPSWEELPEDLRGQHLAVAREP